MEPSQAELLSSVHVPYSFIRVAVDEGGWGFFRAEVGSRRITFANARFCDMIGYSLDEILERKLTLSDLTHPDDIEISERQFDRLASGELESYTLEKRYVLKDSTVLPISGAAAVYERDSTNQARVIMVVVRNLLDAGSVEARVDRGGVAFWARDVRTGSRMCSAGFKQLLGLPPGAPAPTFEDYFALVHPDDRPRVTEKTKLAIRGMLQSGEHRIIRPGGELRWVSHTVKPIFDRSGNLTELVGTCIDFTDTKLDQSYLGSTAKVVKDYIDAHWNEPLSVTILAEAAGVTPRTLFKHCKRDWGLTPHDYIKSVRLKHARAMLQTPDESASVLAIALKCCFQNHGHFARDYRLAFGERPSETLTRRKQFCK